MNQEKIGKFIAKLRKEKNMTQEDLAIKLGTSDKSISRWENGRCMPDLSLFPLLSEELDISINELMSGERVTKKEYQEVFEENVVKTISIIGKNNKNSNLITNIFLGFIVVVFLCFIWSIFCNYFTFFQKYNANDMVITKQEDGDLLFKTTGLGNIKYLLMTHNDKVEKVGLIFVYFEKTLNDYNNDRENNSNLNYIDMTDRLNNGYGILIRDNKNMPSKYKVYYTDVKFKKIIKASINELTNIIKESNLMYENE